MEDQDLDAIIDGAKTAQESVPLCLRADVLSEIGELERKIQTITADDDDPRMAGANDESAAELAARIRALEKVAEDNTINLRLQAVDKKLWKAKVDEHTEEIEDTGERKLDLNALVTDLLDNHETIVSPSFTPARLTKLLNALSDAQWETILQAVWRLNRTTTTVGKSVTASLVFLKRSEKPTPAGQ